MILRTINPDKLPPPPPPPPPIRNPNRPTPSPRPKPLLFSLSRRRYRNLASSSTLQAFKILIITLMLFPLPKVRSPQQSFVSIRMVAVFSSSVRSLFGPLRKMDRERFLKFVLFLDHFICLKVDVVVLKILSLKPQVLDPMMIDMSSKVPRDFGCGTERGGDFR